jgi:capsular polysaccharide export protein
MILRGYSAFADKKILLLQGPVGGFFRHLAADLQQNGATVSKINFNAGDWLFYPRGAINYRGTLDEWPEWFSRFLEKHDFDVVLLFGDCRPIHATAHAIAYQRGIEIGVFEEGYVRPDFVTLERYGVNARSRMPRNPTWYLRHDPPSIPVATPLGSTYWPMVWAGFRYYTAAILGKPWFRHYLHHRPLEVREIWPWLRTVWRKGWYHWRESGLDHYITQHWQRRYFLVPLQVHNDSQVTAHGGVDSVESFIALILRSFAAHAPKGLLLVFKHHPMDRGYRDYTKLINKLSRSLGLAERTLYIHDLPLPPLLDNARGVVVQNSTVGLSALLHGAPTKVFGNAIYDMPGITWQATLDEFWQIDESCRPDRFLVLRFRQHLIAATQLNGSFYKRLPQQEGVFAGLRWSMVARGALNREALSDNQADNGRVLPFASRDRRPREALRYPSPESGFSPEIAAVELHPTTPQPSFTRTSTGISE